VRSDQETARLQSQQMFSYTDDNDAKLYSYNTVDLLAGVRLPVGAVQFGITNLLNTDYDTLWSQRAQEIYGLENLSTFKGQGRTYSVNYSVEF
jgi:iron complex outermembrane receptor protein